MVRVDVELPGPGAFLIDIVGESNYQRELLKICGGKKRRDGVEFVVDAVLVLEDDNRYDNRAVRVDIRGMTVGYLDRETARSYRQRLSEAGHPHVNARVAAMIRGGWNRGGGDEGHFGVKLDLPGYVEVVDSSGSYAEPVFSSDLAELVDTLLLSLGSCTGKTLRFIAIGLRRSLKKIPTIPRRIDSALLTVSGDGEYVIILWFLRCLVIVILVLLACGLLWLISA